MELGETPLLSAAAAVKQSRSASQGNDECRMTNDDGMTKSETRNPCSRAVGIFVIRVSDFIRHSSFVIRVCHLTSFVLELGPVVFRGPGRRRGRAVERVHMW